MKEIDEMKAIELAEKMGLKVSFGNKESSVSIENKGIIKEKELEDYFPEITERI